MITPTQEQIDDNNDWAYDRWKDEEVSQMFSAQREAVPPTENNVY